MAERVAIIGSRDYPDLDAVRAYVRCLPKGSVVVSGGAKGVDSAAESEAKLCGLPTSIYHAEWNKYGKSAGYRRNILIVENANRVVAFQHNRSRGTQHTIDIARKVGKLVEVHDA